MPEKFADMCSKSFSDMLNNDVLYFFHTGILNMFVYETAKASLLLACRSFQDYLLVIYISLGFSFVFLTFNSVVFPSTIECIS